MHIASVGTALPAHYYGQEELLAAFERLWAGRLYNPDRLSRLHRNVRVGGRHLALPIDAYRDLRSFTEANDAYVRCATELGGAALSDALERAGLSAGDVDHIFFVSTTGVATPSLDARIVNRAGLRPDVKRSPIFGLGCVGGVAGVARAADWLAGFDDRVAVVLSVELCSLTLQKQDLSIPNLIASGLFGDGAAAAVLAGELHRSAGEPGRPRVLATRSVFYPDTEDVMGWRIGDKGFRIVLSAEVPDVVQAHVGADVDAFLGDHGLRRSDVARWVCHPGGPRVLEALESALGLAPEALERSWRTLAGIGNLSSASVLFVLRDVMETDPPEPGGHGLMLGMGPGFCSELALLRW